MEQRIEVAYFPIWKRYLDMFRDAQLTDSQLGKLMLIMMAYQFDGVEPTEVPRALRVVWVFLRKDLDDARHRYEVSVQNGRKGGRKKKTALEEPEETRHDPEKTCLNPEEGKSMSRSRSISMSMSDIYNGSAPASSGEEAGLSLEKKAYGEFGWIRLTDRQYEDLESRMGLKELGRCITYIDEAAQTTGNRNRWKDWYLVLRRCYENRWYEPKPQTNEPIPKGASGELGEAELEAIRRIMQCEPDEDLDLSMYDAV